jgi:hypothetical protein
MPGGGESSAALRPIHAMCDADGDLDRHHLHYLQTTVIFIIIGVVIDVTVVVVITTTINNLSALGAEPVLR